ncbi:4-coumarate-CoA ligase-like protein [Teratosphaeria nubilosa]|uniref:4-coumarate-CoA ligase-like protein n=1 Tax=Teratosphaeria nubilosa TaxID=161662 RepID=A0A6G1LHA8_9PEZI|nr:4-coumarate-CoA ligase-like protein [Teratosphaeria nubilosa]
MPVKSPYQDVNIPPLDMWAFMFNQPRDFPDSQVIYRAINSPRHYTFADVKAAATTFGEGLCNLWDWQKGDVLAIYAPNDVDIGPIIYGVFFAGGVVSPANPAYSPSELAFQLSNAAARGIVTTKAFLPNALKAAKEANVPADQIILLGDDRDETHKTKHWTNIRKTSGALRYRRRELVPDKDLAFLVYSSGTTGLPKGVMLTHTNVIADLCLIKGSVGHHYQSGHDKILGVLPFFHIYGLTGLVHQPLHRGIELVVMPAFDLKTFLQTVQEHRISFIYVAPPVIVRLARDKMVEDYDLSSVRMITSGAAPLTRELVDTVHKRLKIKINQAYGLSETSPMTHTQPWSEWYSSVGSVGKLFPNMTAKYVLADGSEAGANEPGELWLSGPNIFQGYWKNEEATSDAVAEEDGLRYFRTGDVGYQDAEHNFYITDRVKELIKYKGFQVAAAELEGKLMVHPLVNDVAIIGVHDADNHTEVPRAYVVHSAGVGKASSKDADDIVKWTSERVANHKRLRGGVRFVEEIPKSAAGKILRRVLKEKAKAEDEGPKAKL